MDFSSRVQTFARDFVFYFMKQWRPEWEPENPKCLKEPRCSAEHSCSSEPSCSERVNNSPFTDNMKRKIKKLIEEENRHAFQKSFENEFPNAEIDEKSFQLMADRYEHNFVILCKLRGTYTPEELFSHCLKLAKFSGLAVCFSVQSAPFIVIDAISQIISILNANALFTESTWIELDTFCSKV